MRPAHASYIRFIFSCSSYRSVVDPDSFCGFDKSGLLEDIVSITRSKQSKRPLSPCTRGDLGLAYILLAQAHKARAKRRTGWLPDRLRFRPRILRRQRCANVSTSFVGMYVVYPESCMIAHSGYHVLRVSPPRQIKISLWSCVCFSYYEFNAVPPGVRNIPSR